MSLPLRSVTLAALAFSLGCVAQGFTKPRPVDLVGFEVMQQGKMVKVRPQGPDNALIALGAVEKSDQAGVLLSEHQTIVIGQRYTIFGGKLLPCIPPYPARLLGCTPVPPPPPGIVCFGGEKDDPVVCFPGDLQRTLGPRSIDRGELGLDRVVLPRQVGSSVSPKGASNP